MKPPSPEGFIPLVSEIADRPMRAVLPAEMSSPPPPSTPPPRRRAWLRLALSILFWVLVSFGGLAAGLVVNYLAAHRLLKVEERAAPL